MQANINFKTLKNTTSSSTMAPTASAIHPSPSPTAKYLQEDNISEECKKLIISLPKDKGWVCDHLFQYQGFWHTTPQLQGVLNCQSNFKALDSDILLVTTPKSGTTWLKALIFALVNRKLHNPVNALPHPLTIQNPHELVPFLELKLYGHNQIDPDLSSFPSPRIFATHLPVVSLPMSVIDSTCKMVYLCRNPMDTFISLWHFTNKLREPKNGLLLPLEEVFDRFCRGVSLYGPFWDHVLGYWKESREKPTRVLFLKYEEVKDDPRLCVERISEFLGCSFSVEEEKSGLLDVILGLCSFENLSNLEVNKNGKLDSGEEKKAFFRRGEVGDYKNYLTPEMVERFEKISEEKLCGSGLKF